MRIAVFVDASLDDAPGEAVDEGSTAEQKPRRVDAMHADWFDFAKLDEDEDGGARAEAEGDPARPAVSALCRANPACYAEGHTDGLCCHEADRATFKPCCRPAGAALHPDSGPAFRVLDPLRLLRREVGMRGAAATTAQGGVQWKEYKWRNHLFRFINKLFHW